MHDDVAYSCHYPPFCHLNAYGAPLLRTKADLASRATHCYGVMLPAAQLSLFRDSPSQLYIPLVLIISSCGRHQ